MNPEVVFQRLIDRIATLESTIQRLQIRQNNMFREGVVTSVDEETGTAIVNAHGVESKPSPWLTQAGEINEWVPLSVGQRVVLVSPGGDMGRSFIMPGGYTDAVKAPDNTKAQKRVKIGGAIITHSAEGLIIEVGGVSYKFTGSGFEQSGGSQTHDGKNVGSTHVHGGVLPGGFDTKDPH
ncbi:hypothetical protein [Rhizobium sp. SSA_523]|uniref:hypothetical protein n=1 Tax=Rhizobium sp. SSA_523 TaxID=2952477 RepID=UPI002091900A|nr:hypothetical protein [Rhizobium sp. SSA_523]MCO5730083.1 hypothetical protein [Rhizobium sp. SSA_523]WKC25148.1 hypothetical protein QTJ18_14265 [Rhizobium sp. SSA_523]